MQIHTMDDLHAHLQQGALSGKELILDVRTPAEYAAGHIAGALNIPHDQVGAHAQKLKGYEKIYIHCKMGGRAVAAMQALQAEGLNNLVCISANGMLHWEARGYPIQKG